MKKLKIHCYTFLIFLMVFFFSWIGSGVELTDSSSSAVFLPAGTRMVIPLKIMAEYQVSSDEWGHPFFYLSEHYSTIELSTWITGQTTFYVPLSREDGENREEHGETVMMDIMNVNITDEGIFKTVQNTYVIKVMSGNKYIFIAVSDIDIGNCLFVLSSKKDCDMLGYSVR